MKSPESMNAFVQTAAIPVAVFVSLKTIPPMFTGKFVGGL